MNPIEIAVIGPFVSDRLGVVQQCIRCRRAAGPDAPECPGFGPGCLVPHTAENFSRVPKPVS